MVLAAHRDFDEDTGRACEVPPILTRTAAIATSNLDPRRKWRNLPSPWPPCLAGMPAPAFANIELSPCCLSVRLDSTGVIIIIQKLRQSHTEGQHGQTVVDVSSGLPLPAFAASPDSSLRGSSHQIATMKEQQGLRMIGYSTAVLPQVCLAAAF